MYRYLLPVLLPTLRVAPTERVSAPVPSSVPVGVGLLVQCIHGHGICTTANGGCCGRQVMEYVNFAWPVTSKEAAVTVPGTAGRVTPPVTERAPAGSRTTVLPGCTNSHIPKIHIRCIGNGDGSNNGCRGSSSGTDLGLEHSMTESTGRLKSKKH